MCAMLTLCTPVSETVGVLGVFGEVFVWTAAYARVGEATLAVLRYLSNT